MENRNRKRTPVIMKIIIAAGIVLIMLISVFLLGGTRIISNYKSSLTRFINSIFYNSDSYDDTYSKIVESDDFEKIENQVPFKIEKPMWLPEGYELNGVDYQLYENDSYNVNYNYIKDEDILSFSIATSAIWSPDDFTMDYIEAEINGFSVYILQFSENSCQAHYINSQGFKVFIGGNIDTQTLTEIIKNMG